MSGHVEVDTTHESGFSLVEMVVAMVLLGVIALAFLPVVAQATRSVASSSTLATAARLVSQEMEQVRATPLTTCPAPGPQAGATVTDGRGLELQTWVQFDEACTEPGVVRYVVYVTRPSTPGARLAAASTFVEVAPQ